MDFEVAKTFLIGNICHLYKRIGKVYLNLISLVGQIMFIICVSMAGVEVIPGPYQRNVNSPFPLDPEF